MMKFIPNAKPSDLPLVSVVVITYNSAKYVLETLESIKNQTYANIELVISDDCSRDNTLDLCKAWLKENEARFQSTCIIGSTQNTGVAPNCNRGLKVAQGEWVKLIAGDDVIFRDGIEVYMKFVLNNTYVKVVVSDAIFFGNKSGKFNINSKINAFSQRRQLRSLLLNDGGGVPAFGPSGFCNLKTINEIGGYDETFPMIEDYPLSLRFLDCGIKIYALNYCCVGYRINSGSISTDKEFLLKYKKMYELCAFPIIRKRRMYLVLWHWHVKTAAELNKRKVCRYLLKASSIYVWANYFSKRIFKVQ